MQLRTVLVATDFSEHAERALDHAIELAGPVGAVVQLVYVCHLPVQVAMPEMVAVPAAVWDDMRDSGRKRLSELASRVEKAGLECHAHLSEGLPSRVILAMARRFDADLIVMGTRGHSGLRHVMFGSVAERTVRGAECPVLTVHADGPAKPLRVKTLLVPLDFSPASDRALEEAESLSRSHGPAHLLLLHGYHVPVELEEFMIQQSRSAPLVEQISGGVTARLEKTLTELQDRGISSEYIADQGNPEHLIGEIARSKGADLIVMGTHGRRGLSHLLLGSVAERVVRTAGCPVLTVRAEGSHTAD